MEAANIAASLLVDAHRDRITHIKIEFARYRRVIYCSRHGIDVLLVERDDLTCTEGHRVAELTTPLPFTLLYMFRL